jgi:hypothetical protein
MDTAKEYYHARIDSLGEYKGAIAVCVVFVVLLVGGGYCI